MIQDIKYLKTSWAMLTSKRGWFKHALVLAILQFIPIIGMMAALGYIYSWVRRSAWSMRTSPVDTKIDAKEFIKLGAVIWVFNLIVQGVISSLIFGIQGAVSIVDPFFTSSLLGLAGTVVNAVVGVVIIVMSTIYTIYRDTQAYFKLSDIWEMLSKDWKGIFKITAMGFIFSTLVGIVFVILFILILIPIIVTFTSIPGLAHISADDLSFTYVLNYISAGPIVGTALALLLLAYLMILASLIVELLVSNAVGIWVSQFVPSIWGSLSESDPFRLRTPHSYFTPAPVASDESQMSVTPATAAPAESAAASAEPAADVLPPAQAPAETIEALAETTETPVETAQDAESTTGAEAGADAGTDGQGAAGDQGTDDEKPAK